MVFPVIPVIHLEAISDTFLHGSPSPTVLENQLDLRICLPPSLLWLFGSGQVEDLCVDGSILCIQTFHADSSPSFFVFPSFLCLSLPR